MTVTWIDNTAGAVTNCTWATCPSCGARYWGYHNCGTVVPQPAQWQPTPVYIQSQPWRLADEDVERIAQRIAELIDAKEASP